jgi:hypothetical protein
MVAVISAGLAQKLWHWAQVERHRQAAGSGGRGV